MGDMARWELAPHLAAKYPWLRVDSSTIDEFRAPFDWGRSSSSSSSSCSSASAADVNDDANDGRKERSAGLSGRRRRDGAGLQSNKKRSTTTKKNVTKNGRLASGNRGRRRPANTPTRASHNQDVPGDGSTPLKLPPASRNIVSPSCAQEQMRPRATNPGGLAVESPAWLAVRTDFEATVKPRKPQRLRKTQKTRLQAFSLQLPVLPSKKSAASATPKTPVNTHARQLQQYTKELEMLHKDEERLKSDVAARIEAERAKLPLTFLFQRNLELRSYCKEKGVATITQIFSKLQHRLLFSAFERWQSVNELAQKEERKQVVFEQSQARAIKLFERLASDAYVGTIERAFLRWRVVARSMVDAERNSAAAIIQWRFRKRRAMALATVLKQASLDAEYKRKMEIQQLLRFESYGTTMLWSTLRLGFNVMLQNHCARRIQFFFRRLAVQNRVRRRVAQRQVATKIETQWRMHLARADLAKKRAEAARRRTQERRAATVIQCQARRLAAKKQLSDLRLLQVRRSESAERLQRWWCKCKSRWSLQERFKDRKQMLLEEQARLERLCLETLKEQRRQEAVLAIQRVARGWFGRLEYRRRLRAKHLDLAARRVQASWRKSKGRYALHLRFVAQGNRLEERRNGAALKIQCCYRVYVAKTKRYQLQHERNRRHVAAITIQRKVRQYFVQKRYRHKRRSTIIVQKGMRSKLTKLQRQRLLFEREQRRVAAVRIQCWARSVAARIFVKAFRWKKQEEKQRRKQSAIMIQKRVRGVEVRNMVKLLKDAIATVELEQSRHFQESRRQCSSELLDFVAKRYFTNPETVGAKRFTALEYDWLLNQVSQSKQQMKEEDRAIVFLQRYYRGYACRAAFWVMKLREKQQREREQRAAILLQRVARGFLARRRVRRRRQQRKMEQLKAKYIQERRWKEQEQQWQEQYQREQLEIQIRRAKQLEMKVIHAKREAELAKFQAEAAMYRKQEQQAQKEQEPQRKKPQLDGGDDRLKREKVPSQWEKLSDEYGNDYFYNAQTGESRWDLPPEKTDPDGPPTAATLADDESQEQPDPPAKSVNAESTTDTDEKTKDGKPSQEATAQEGNDSMCSICKAVRATKQCVDCVNGLKPSAYCTSCFTQEHYGALAASAKRAHDFKALVKTEVRSRCRSQFGCSEAGKAGERRLATYFCYECHTSAASKEDATAESSPGAAASDDTSKSKHSGVDSETRGCFYCDDCFPQAHETALGLQHVTSALHFKTGAHLCSECSSVVAARHCEQCDERLCSKCFDRIHGNSRIKREHIYAPIEITKEEFESEKDAYCIECDVRRSDRLCNLCGDGFCERCFTESHAKGAKQGHTWIPWSSFEQVGDWLEIWDEKANAKIFFNLETKESTTKQPFVLKSATERHQLRLAEREQQHKRRELELESELIKLKEQLREMEEKETKAAQRPLSRDLVSGGGARSSDANSQQTLVTKSTAEEKKPKKKKGLLSRLLPRSKKSSDLPEEEPTEDEKKRKQLVDGVQDAERELIMSKMKTRARKEKEAKARETVGTTLFQQAMVQELTQSK